MLNRPELMLRLTHTLAELPAADPLPLRMCTAFVRTVRATSGSIVLGYGETERSLLCATDTDAARYQDMQDVVREGPSLDAFRTGAVVASWSLADRHHRWPELAATVSDPWTVVQAVPIHPDAAVIGVLTVHDGTLMHHDETELSFLADAIGTAIIGDLPSNDDESRLWNERDRVSQATGMVIAQLGVAAGDALALLRAYAFAHETSVIEVSRRVVDRSLDFSRPERGGSS